MRRPPSPALLPAYPVAGGIGLMATAVTVMTLSGRWSLDRFVMSPTAFTNEPWRLLTCALPHGDPLHILFDAYWFWVFGTLLEEVLGHLRLLALVALFAAGSAAAEWAISGGGIGLSGVDYGLFGMLWVLSSRDRRFADGVDARTVQLMVAWFFFCIVATQMNVMAIANVAHGAGAVLGALVGAAMSLRPPWRRPLAAIGVTLVLAASFAGATRWRARINLSHDGHPSFQLGYDAIQEGRFDDAVRHYKDATAIEPDNARAWHNLGVAYDRLGRDEEALAAYRRAYELDRTLEAEGAFAQYGHFVASAAFTRGDGAKAIAILDDIVSVEPNDARAWELLARVHQSLGHEADARRARDRLSQLAADAGAR